MPIESIGVINWGDDGWGSIQPDLVLLQLEDLASDATALVSFQQHSALIGFSDSGHELRMLNNI